MRAGSRSKAGIFLLEFIIVLLVFSLSSIVTVRLFSTSHRIQQQVENTDKAVIYSQNISELLKACDGSNDALADIIGENGTVYLDKNWNETIREAAVFIARTEMLKEESTAGRYLSGAIEVSYMDEVLYSLPFGIFYSYSMWGAQ